MDYDMIDAEVRRLFFELRTADEETIAAHATRLRAMAKRITEDQSRRRAVERAGDLLDLVRPSFRTSQYYREAVALVDLADSYDGPIGTQVAELNRLARRTDRLIREAPDREYRLIADMRGDLNSRLHLLRACHEGTLDVRAIRSEVVTLGYRLRGAEDDVVAVHQERLRAVAQWIVDESDRQSAFRHIDELPALVRPPAGVVRRGRGGSRGCRRRAHRG